MLTASDRRGQPIDEHLGRVAADRRADRAAGRRADAAAEQRARVRVLPREHVDDRDGVDASPSSDRRRLRVGVGGARGHGEQIDRLKRRCGVSTRCWVWPAPTSTGVRGSMGMGQAPYRRPPAARVRLGRRALVVGIGRGVGQVGTPGAALSGQIDRYRQEPQTSISATPANAWDAAAAWIAAAVTRSSSSIASRSSASGSNGSGSSGISAARCSYRTRSCRPSRCRDRRGEPRLEPGAGVVGDALGDDRARLVVPDLEQAVVLPDRIEATGRHEHRCGAPVEARDLELVLGVFGRRRAPLRVPVDDPGHGTVGVDAVRARGPPRRAPCRGTTRHGGSARASRARGCRSPVTTRSRSPADPSTYLSKYSRGHRRHMSSELALSGTMSGSNRSFIPAPGPSVRAEGPTVPGSSNGGERAASPFRPGAPVGSLVGSAAGDEGAPRTLDACGRNRIRDAGLDHLEAGGEPVVDLGHDRTGVDDRFGVGAAHQVGDADAHGPAGQPLRPSQ